MIKPQCFYKLGKYSVIWNGNVVLACVPHKDASEVAKKVKLTNPTHVISILHIGTNKMREVK